MPESISNQANALTSIRQQVTSNTAAANTYRGHLDFAEHLQMHSKKDAASVAKSVSGLIKPSPGYFAECAGVDYKTAVELVYGVVGSNGDQRDWSAIMSSDDPLTAARQATAAMYNSGAEYSAPDSMHLQTEQAQSAGNFALHTQLEGREAVIHEGLNLVDSQGMLLRYAGNNAEKISRNAWLFGFDTQPLAQLVEPAGRISQELSSAIATVANSGASMTPQWNILEEPSSSASALDAVLSALDNSTEAADDTVSAVEGQENAVPDLISEDQVAETGSSATMREDAQVEVENAASGIGDEATQSFSFMAKRRQVDGFDPLEAYLQMDSRISMMQNAMLMGESEGLRQ